MKTLKLILANTLIIAVSISLTACNHKSEQVENTANSKPYPLDTCLVCGMKLSMMKKPVVFVYQGQEIKVCDAGEKADFEKEPIKFLKTLEGAGVESKK